MSYSANGVYVGGRRQILLRVYLNEDVGILQGEGVCYERDYGTAADKENRRGTYVKRASTSYNTHFAGVATKTYKAITGGQFIEIAEPGSTCLIAAGVDTVVNSTVLTCSASEGDKGRFTLKGYEGRGSALALETETVSKGSSWTGTATYVNSTKTLTDTGEFADSVAGDYVYVVGGSSASMTMGRYVIESVTDDDNVVLTTAIGADGSIIFYTVTGNPKVLAYLMTGEESGLQEVVSPVDDTAAQSMVGGVSYIAGGYTMGTGVSTATLANGTKLNEKKAFIGLGALTTNGWVLTCTTAKQLNKSTALATVTIDAAAEVAYLRWYDSSWILDWSAGATLASS